MLNIQIKRAILEAKEIKEKSLIEKSLIKDRILMIVESEENIKNFKFLPNKKQEKIVSELIHEIRFLQQNGILKEGLRSTLREILGNQIIKSL